MSPLSLVVAVAVARPRYGGVATWAVGSCSDGARRSTAPKRCTESAGGSGDNGGYANQGGADGGWGSVPDDGGVANLDDWDEGPIEVEW